MRKNLLAVLGSTFFLGCSNYQNISENLNFVVERIENRSELETQYFNYLKEFSELNSAHDKLVDEWIRENPLIYKTFSSNSPFHAPMFYRVLADDKDQPVPPEILGKLSVKMFNARTKMRKLRSKLWPKKE